MYVSIRIIVESSVGALAASRLANYFVSRCKVGGVEERIIIVYDVKHLKEDDFLDRWYPESHEEPRGYASIFIQSKDKSLTSDEIRKFMKDNESKAIYTIY